MSADSIVRIKGWYSQDGWSTKLILVNRYKGENRVKLEFYYKESERLVMERDLKLGPHEIRTLRLGRLKGLKGSKGVLMAISEHPIAGEIIMEEVGGKGFMSHGMREVDEECDTC